MPLHVKNSQTISITREQLIPSSMTLTIYLISAPSKNQWQPIIMQQLGSGVNDQTWW